MLIRVELHRAIFRLDGAVAGSFLERDIGALALDVHRPFQIAAFHRPMFAFYAQPATERVQVKAAEIPAECHRRFQML